MTFIFLCLLSYMIKEHNEREYQFFSSFLRKALGHMSHLSTTFFHNFLIILFLFIFKIHVGKTIMKFENRRSKLGWYKGEVTSGKKLCFFDKSLDQWKVAGFTIILSPTSIPIPICQPSECNCTASMRESIWNLIEFLKRPSKYQPILVAFFFQ